jgi:hypothetical protein
VAYIGNDLAVAYPNYRNIDDISASFNGSTTSFALLVNGAAPVPQPLNSQQCLISVGGVLQRPDDTGSEGFRLSGGNIIFSSAPATSEDFFGVVLAGADYVNAGANFPDGQVGAPSITFDQDNDTGFYRSGSGAVSFTSNGVGTATFGSASFVAPSFIPTSSTAPTNGIYLPAANSVAISTNSTSRLYVNSSGSVGIGTTSPSAPLHINGTANNTAITLSVAGTVTGYIGPAGFLGGSDSSLGYRAETGNNHAFFIGASEAARIDSSRRLLVGTSTARSIGTLAAASQCQIEGTSSATSFQSLICNANGSAGPGIALGKSRSTSIGGTTIVSSGDTLGRIHFEGADGTNLIQGAAIVAEVDGTPGANDMPGRLVFSTTADGASSPTERMRISSSGWVSLKTGTNSVANAGNIYFNPDGNATNVPFVGVGGASSSNGDVCHAVYSTSLGQYQFYVGYGGTVYARSTSISSLSDQREKQNIQDLDAGLSEILALRPRRFDWKDGSGQNIAGFIAQEVELVLPDLVEDYQFNESETRKSLKMGDIIPALVKAIQEQQAVIVELQAKVAALESA